MIPTKYGPIEIIYEDNHLLVINKPVGIPVQADASGDEDLQSVLKSWIKDRDQKPGNVYLGIVHRLDRPVGGVMILAKTSKAAGRLSDQIRRNTIEKYYVAVLQKQPDPPQGVLKHYLEKNAKTNTVSVVSEKSKKAKFAELDYQVLKHNKNLTLVWIKLKTGRPHQIRVQFSYSGWPLLGDQKYGGSAKGSPALFSRKMIIQHPTQKEQLEFEAKPSDTYPWNLFG